MTAQKYLNVVTTLMLVTIWGVLIFFAVAVFKDAEPIGFDDPEVLDAYWSKVAFDAVGDKPTIVKAPCPIKDPSPEAIENAPICNYQLIAEADVEFDLELETE